MSRWLTPAVAFTAIFLFAGQAWAADPPSQAAPTRYCAGEIAFDGRYCRDSVEGWIVFFDMKLLRGRPDTAGAARHLLRTKLRDIATALPSQRVTELRRVPIWLELKVSGDGRFHYHPGGSAWPRKHGFPEAKIGSVDFGDAERFVREDSNQPSAVLHELAHAYHNQVLGHRNAAVLRAYKNAVESGIYREVKRNSGRVVTAYALTNEKEYFAELTEAYFGLNDFFPFNRAELRSYDPIGFEAIRAAWEDHPSQVEHTVARCGGVQPASFCCPHEAGLHSVSSRDATRLVVRNATKHQINIIWLDFDGNRKSYASIPTGALHVQETFGAHAWLFADKTGHCVATVIAERNGLAIRLVD